MNLFTAPLEMEGGCEGVFKGLGEGPVPAEQSAVFRRSYMEGLGFTSGMLKVRARSALSGGWVCPSCSACTRGVSESDGDSEGMSESDGDSKGMSESNGDSKGSE